MPNVSEEKVVKLLLSIDDSCVRLKILGFQLSIILDQHKILLTSVLRIMGLYLNFSFA